MKQNAPTQTLSALKPVAVWKQFEALNAVPRPSKKEEQVIAFMVDFGKGLGLETETDAAGNVLIRKPGSAGKEDLSPVALQAHLDMVHQKNAGTQFDFSSEGIRMYTDGDWVRARGTTLGADNGLGVAAIMAVLEATDLSHPPIEALFTIDEETGMTGAKSLESGWMTAPVLLNLDTEEDHVLTVGCAGGVDVTATGSYRQESLPEDYVGLCVRVKGLQGGHSGMDIHRGRGNANKLLARILQKCGISTDLRIASFEGGNLRNAIPREAEAVVALSPGETDRFQRVFEDEARAICEEYAPEEPQLDPSWSRCDRPDTAMHAEDQESLLNALNAVLSGVYFMSYAFPGQTETSNSLARVAVRSGAIEIACLTRSSVESRKADLVQSLRSVWDMAGYQTATGGDYPGWQPDPDSEVLGLLQQLYQARFGEVPTVEASHGGLECGIIKAAYPQMDMISFGPTILGAHSPDERASISSTQKFWLFLKDILAAIEP